MNSMQLSPSNLAPTCNLERVKAAVNCSSTTPQNPEHFGSESFMTTFVQRLQPERCLLYGFQNSFHRTRSYDAGTLFVFREMCLLLTK